MTELVAATRMELLRIRARKKLATKGHSLLKRKRDVLIRKFFEYIKEYKERRARTVGILEDAYDVLHIGQGVSGVHRMKTLAFSMLPSYEVDVTKQNLMGVKVHKIDLHEKEAPQNASLIGTSYHVEDAREKFKSLLPDLVKLAEIERLLATLAEEIKKTKRRVNALEFITIPQLEETERHIKAALAEIEREAFVRLKNVKKKIES